MKYDPCAEILRKTMPRFTGSAQEQLEASLTWLTKHGTLYEAENAKAILAELRERGKEVDHGE